jgi:iron complex transport system permease protein
VYQLKKRGILLLTAVVLAAAAVSVTGGIAFVGLRLRVPQFARAVVGPRNQLFLPVAILIRDWVLLLAEYHRKRNILEPKGIPAGIMIALIGAP